MRERLKNMPVPVVATMLGAATLSNVYPVSYTHLTLPTILRV